MTVGCQLMGFTLPTFNLMCNVHGVVAGVNSFRLSIECNLAMGRRINWLLGVGAVQNGGGNAFTPTLLVPAGTDVRDSSCGGEMDIIEVPAGSGRWYMAIGVDDIGKGFANEHRCVALEKTWGFAGNGSGLTLPWPTPIP